MRRTTLTLVLAVLPATMLLGAVRAAAQGDPAPAASTSASAPPSPVPTVAPETTSKPPKMTPPPAPPTVVTEPHPSEVYEAPEAKAEKAEKTKSDHEKVVGRFGIGYFGQYDVPLGFGAAISPGTPVRAPTEAAQMIGFRYWWSRVRLDVAFGWNMGSGTQTAGGVKSDQVSTLVLAGRVAVPFALYVGDHYTFFMGPEISYGSAGETVPARQPTIPGIPRPADTTHSGKRFTLGGRAGAEVQFGFIGIPHLALDATIGLALDLTKGETTGPGTGPAVPGEPAPTASGDYARTAIRSSTQHQPWNIFVSNVAAVYYF
jgi:hypothetical protein